MALLLSRRVQPPLCVVSSQPALSATVTVSHEPALGMTDEPAVKPVETLPPVPSDSVAPPAARPVKHHISKPVNPADSSPPMNPRPDTFVSPIRDPGF